MEWRHHPSILSSVGDVLGYRDLMRRHMLILRRGASVGSVTENQVERALDRGAL
jgi:hypothetical protein